MNRIALVSARANLTEIAVQAALLHSVRSVRDNMLTYDSAQRTMDNLVLSGGMQMPIDSGRPLAYGVPGQYGRGVQTHDGRTADSTGAFLVGELERLDLKLHKPLASVTWSRDIDLREDVSIADEVSSFTLTTYGSQGGLGTGNSIGNGKSWMGKTSDQITGIGVDISKVVGALNLWGMEIKYSIPELESAAKLGRPIDQQKHAGLELKHQMDIDEQVNIGDTSLGLTGLVNNALMTNVGNVVAGAAGGTTWVTKTPDEILTDVNSLITSIWAASAWEIMPSELRLPPAQFGYLSTQKVSLAGNISILKYLQDNSVLTTTGNGKLNIQPLKWCIGSGAGGTVGTTGTVDRMLAYTKDKDRVRFPMTLLQRTPLQYDSLFHKCTYFCRLGQVELVYPETMGAADGI